MDGTLLPNDGAVTGSLGRPAPVEKQRSRRRADLDGWTLQERLSTLLSWDEGARTLALKLYSRFEGNCEKLPPLLELLEERWGFPQRLWPLLWAQLRRENKGPWKRIGGVQAPEFVSQGQWLAAFSRWLQSLRARLGQQKVSRKMMVRRRLSSDVGAEEQYFHGPMLGEGAYGEVYAMFHRSLGVKRAVKVIHKSRLSVSPVVAEDEVRVLKALDHPHVIRIYEAFERRDTLHIVMDWAEGGTLAAVLSTQRTQGRTISEAWACTAAQQMCAALEYIHFKGVVHCDLKPENAMLLRAVDPMRNEAPHLVLVDFGLAEIVEARQNGGPLMIRGTAVYLSPEGFEAAKKAGVPYMLPTLSSYTLDEMLAARAPDQVVFSQLYVNPERSRSEEYVSKLEKAGVQALFVTVDAPQLGRREKDMRNKFTQQGSDVQGDDEDDGAVDRSQGATRAISSYIDPGLNWEDVPWLKKITSMKVLLKGVQCGEDAVEAFKAGLAGCVLSNHGGRQLDTCRPGIEVLPEVMEALKEAGATKENFAVFIDGGVRRGGDIFKAVALGAQACGVGRPVLYSLASYGQNGIVRMVHMLQDELQMVMRLAGTPNIPSITEKHVITTNLADHIVPLPVDNLTMKTYQGLEPAAKL